MKFTSLESYTIKDRGTVFVVENPKDDETDFKWVRNKKVEIDGNNYLIIGVEKWAIPY